MVENSLKKSFEVRYDMLLNAIPSSVLIIDRKLQVLSVNENFLSKSQRSKENTVCLLYTSDAADE